MSSPSDPGEGARTHEDRPPAEAAPTVAPLRVTLPAVPVSASLARDHLRRWLRALRWPASQLGDTLLAVNEAVSNCVEHAYRSAVPGFVEIGGRVVRDPLSGCRVELTVQDRGSWRPPSAEVESRGRGIPLMRACMEHVTIHGTDEGTMVTLLSRAVPHSMAVH